MSTVEPQKSNFYLAPHEPGRSAGLVCTLDPIMSCPVFSLRLIQGNELVFAVEELRGEDGCISPCLLLIYNPRDSVRYGV